MNPFGPSPLTGAGYLGSLLSHCLISGSPTLKLFGS